MNTQKIIAEAAARIAQEVNEAEIKEQAEIVDRLYDRAAALLGDEHWDRVACRAITEAQSIKIMRAAVAVIAAQDALHDAKFTNDQTYRFDFIDFQHQRAREAISA